MIAYDNISALHKISSVSNFEYEAENKCSFHMGVLHVISPFNLAVPTGTLLELVQRSGVRSTHLVTQGVYHD